MVVGPLMLLELLLAFYLAWHNQWNIVWVLPLVVVLLIWGLTFFWAVPLHEKLSLDPSDLLIGQLLLANWPRTILWTIKAIWVACH